MFSRQTALPPTVAYLSVTVVNYPASLAAGLVSGTMHPIMTATGMQHKGPEPTWIIGKIAKRIPKINSRTPLSQPPRLRPAARRGGLPPHRLCV